MVEERGRRGKEGKCVIHRGGTTVMRKEGMRRERKREGKKLGSCGG